MRISAVLLLVAIGTAVALPQRSGRRFFPRQDEDESTAIDARGSASSATDDGVPFDDNPVVEARSSASAPRTRTRGDIKFLESLSKSNLPTDQAKLNQLQNSRQGLNRASSKPSNRSVSVPSFSRTPSRHLSNRKTIEESKPSAFVAEKAQEASGPNDEARDGEVSNQESRRQRLLQLQKRPRAKASPLAHEEAAQELPESESSLPVENVIETQPIAKVKDDKVEKMTEPTLDAGENKRLDETIKEDIKQDDKDGMTVPARVAHTPSTPEAKSDNHNHESFPESSVDAEPESTSTTTPATLAPKRRVNTLTRLRSSRISTETRTPSSAAPSNRGSRTEESSSAGAAPVATPRLPMRRGGRGNSRGGAALATPARVSRPSSRVPAFRGNVGNGEVAATEAQTEAPQAEATTRKFSSRRGARAEALFTNRRPLHSLSELLISKRDEQLQNKTAITSVDVSDTTVNVDNQQEERNKNDAKKGDGGMIQEKDEEEVRNSRKLPSGGSQTVQARINNPRRQELRSLAERFRNRNEEHERASSKVEQPTRQNEESIAEQLRAINTLLRRPLQNDHTKKGNDSLKPTFTSQRPALLSTTPSPKPPTKHTSTTIETSTSVVSTTQKHTGQPTSQPATRETESQRTTSRRPWRPRVAPEEPSRARNRGGYRHMLHLDSERDIVRIGGQVVITEVGTVEDTPPQQVRAILAGLGGRRRGLARPPTPVAPPPSPVLLTASSQQQHASLDLNIEPDVDEVLYDDYYYN